MTWLMDSLRWLWSSAPAPMSPVTGHPDDGESDLQIDEEGWLFGTDVERIPSVRHSPLSTPQPIAIMWHYTATDPGTARNLAKRIRTYKKGVDRAASWHVCVATRGQLIQSVPFTRGAWHCRIGTVRGYAAVDRPRAGEHRVNLCSVGIELEGHGQEFPAEQSLAAGRLLRALVRNYPITRENAQLQHSVFDPTRRKDPGPEWMKILPAHLELAYSERERNR